jgi:glutamyl-tRNA reductase
VANRSFPRAVELAQKIQGEAVHFDRIEEHMIQVDIVISSTAAPHPIIKYEDVVRLIRARKNRPIFFIDIAVPRDIEPKVNTIDNVYLYDLDDLTGVVAANRAEREAEAKVAEEIVRKEADAFHAWVRTLNLSPLIVGVRERMDSLRSGEMERFRSRLSGLTPEQQRAVEELTGSLLNKILHHPIRALKNSVHHKDSLDRVHFFREIFGIDDSPAGTERSEESRPEPAEPGGDEDSGRG